MAVVIRADGENQRWRARMPLPLSFRAPEMAPNQADLAALAELVESGKVTPVIDRGPLPGR